MTDQPNDPISQLAAAAVGLHEMKLSLTEAGFTEGQAIYLVACAMMGGPLPPKDAKE